MKAQKVMDKSFW